MANIFYEGRPNFPADETELKARLAEVEKLVCPDEEIPQVNVKFVLAAGQLMQDCGLITERNLNYLCDAVACKSFNPDFRFQFNLSEGALRAVDDDDDVFDEFNNQRFYRGGKRRLELLNGRHYLFSNDWYSCNKRQFYRWIAANARRTCETVWNRCASHLVGDIKLDREITDELIPEKISVTVDKPDELSKIIELLKSLHAKVDALTLEIAELKNPNGGNFHD